MNKEDMEQQSHDYYIKDWCIKHHLSIVGGHETLHSGTMICPSNELIHKKTVSRRSWSENGANRIRYHVDGVEAEFISGVAFEEYFNLNPVDPKDTNWVIV